MIHIDTSYLIRALHKGTAEDRALRQWLTSGTPLGICSIAWAEFLCGPLNRGDRELAARVLAERVPFGEEHATIAAALFNETGRRRGSLADCMIAAVAIRANEPLATANSEDFERFAPQGLQLVQDQS